MCVGYAERKCICGMRDVWDLSRTREVERDLLIAYLALDHICICVILKVCISINILML